MTDADEDEEPVQTSASQVESVRAGRARVRPRRTEPRSISIPESRVAHGDLALGIDTDAPIEFDLDADRPRTRGDCQDEARPCPWVACRHHLYLDINPETGSIKINFPELEPLEMSHTCSLDVAEKGGGTLEEVGEVMNLTRERIRQLEVKASHKYKAASPLYGIRERDGAQFVPDRDFNPEI